MIGLAQPATATEHDAASHRRGLALVAVAALLWSTGGLIVRSLDAADVWTTVFWRSVFAALFLVLFIAARDRSKAVQAFRAMGFPSLVVGVCFATASIGLVVALNLTTVANTLIIFSTSPLIAAVLGRVLLGERVRGRSWVVMTAALLGIAVMVSDSFARGSVAGDLIAFVVAGAAAVATVTIRKNRDVRMTPATCLAAVIAALLALPLAAPLSVTGADFGLLFVFGAIQLGAGLALFVTGARLAPAAEVALISVLEPILGPVWVWAFLGENPGTFALIGGGIVLSALAIHTALDLRAARPILPAV
ncbi:MAG: DMT family transporter [Dongiaceae bacterium]